MILQSLQNAAARLITGPRRRDHITRIYAGVTSAALASSSEPSEVQTRLFQFGASGIVRSNAYLPG